MKRWAFLYWIEVKYPVSPTKKMYALVLHYNGQQGTVFHQETPLSQVYDRWLKHYSQYRNQLLADGS